MPDHVKWLVDSGVELETTDGKKVKVIQLKHLNDEVMLSKWAKHLREHYILDSELDDARTPTGLSRKDYLKNIKFPSDSSKLGPIVRSGDFSEILVADYIEFSLRYLVPRTRYNNKINRDSSPHGVDILGFRMGATQAVTDELMTCEVKALLSSKRKGRFQKAIDDSKKDFLFRRAEALNAMRQRLKEKNELAKVNIIDRFQNKTDRPYKEITAAVLVSSNHCMTDYDITSVNATHDNVNLYLFVIKGDKLMELVNKLYEIAHDSA